MDIASSCTCHALQWQVTDGVVEDSTTHPRCSAKLLWESDMFMTERKPIDVHPTQMIITRRGECNALKERRMRVFSEAQFPAPKFGVLAVSPPPPPPPSKGIQFRCKYSFRHSTSNVHDSVRVWRGKDDNYC